MKVVVLVEDFYPNTSGGAHVRWRFSQLASQRGHDLTVYTPKRNGLPETETRDGVLIRRPFRSEPSTLPAYAPVAFLFRILFSIRLAIHLCWSADLEETDGVHSASNTLHWVGKVVSMQRGLPLVCFVGYTPSLNPEVELSPKLLLERFAFRFFLGEVTFCRTPEIRELIASKSSTDARIIHGILNEEELREAAAHFKTSDVREKYGIRETERLLVSVGRLTPVKNPTGAVSVLNQLPSEYHLLIIGEGEEKEPIAEMVQDWGLSDRVTLTGVLPHREALEAMAAADGLLLTSKVESYSAVALEALAFGTPVFGTAVGVLPELEHEHLYIGSISNMPAMIRQAEYPNSTQLDEGFLSKYSMSRYTNDLLGAFERLTYQHSPTAN